MAASICPEWSEVAKHQALTLAYQGIYHQFGKVKEALTKDQWEKELKERRPLFVTLLKEGHLRGCIGTLVAADELGESIPIYAQKAATEDFRFPVLQQSELDSIQIEISILGESQKVEFNSEADLYSKVTPGLDGIILSQGHLSATFLPSVWQQLPDKVLFFRHLKIKAGLSENLDLTETQIARYQCIKITYNSAEI